MDSLPDVELHDLLHKLANLQEELNQILTEIYTHIELREMHEQTVRKMIDGTKPDTNG